MIGLVLVAEGFGSHIPKGYIYGAMGFSVFVELLNIRTTRRTRPVAWAAKNTTRFRTWQTYRAARCPDFATLAAFVPNPVIESHTRLTVTDMRNTISIATVLSVVTGLRPRSRGELRCRATSRPLVSAGLGLPLSKGLIGHQHPSHRRRDRSGLDALASG